MVSQPPNRFSVRPAPFMPPFMCFFIHSFAPLRLQDSSSGNTSDVESQEGGAAPAHKGKGKDRTTTPSKEGTPRHPHKASATTPVYKVEDKPT